MFIGSELFRQGPRPKAMAVVGVSLWIAAFVIAIGFEPLQVASQNKINQNSSKTELFILFRFRLKVITLLHMDCCDKAKLCRVASDRLQLFLTLLFYYNRHRLMLAHFVTVVLQTCASERIFVIDQFWTKI